MEDGQVWFTLAGVTAEATAVRITLPVEEFVSDRALLAALTASAGARRRGPVRAGMGAHLRPAIQMLTRGDRVRTRCYGRTGWAEVDGRLRFLQPGRAVDGLQVRIRKQPYEDPGAAERAAFDADPARREEVLAGFRSLLRSLDPRRTTVIAALMFQAPLGKLAGWLSDRYAVFIGGRTGSLKTSFAQTLMCLYGAGFAADQSLLKFGEGATRNAILSYAEQANDMVLLIDNFKPNTGDGCRGFVNLLHNLVEGGGRERLNQRAQLQESKPIECWPLFTGEDVPVGDAASMARLLVVTVAWTGEDGAPGGHNAALAEAQARRQDFPLLGAAWLDWLESDAGRAAAKAAGGRFEERRAAWASRLRERGQPVANPLRVASNLASNELAWEVLGQHPLLGPLAREFEEAHARGLGLLMGEMARQTAENLEGVRFLEVLRQLLAGGECVLLHRRDAAIGREVAAHAAAYAAAYAGGNPVVVGWHAPEGGAYLLPDLARREVERVLGGDGLNRISLDALYAQLDALGYVGGHEEGRRTKKVRVGAATVRVLHLTGRALAVPAGDACGPSDAEGADPVPRVPAFPAVNM